MTCLDVVCNHGGEMNIYKAIDSCHVRSAIYRQINPKLRYYKNHTVPLLERIPDRDKTATDWEEYDPRDDDDCSMFMFND
jgi:hypothetical protein